MNTFWEQCLLIKSNWSVRLANFDSVQTFILFGCWVIIFGCFVGFDNLVTVFQCSIVTDSMSKMFGFSTVSTSWVIIFDFILGFKKLEVVLVSLIVTDFISALFGNFSIFVFKNNSYYSLALVGSGIILVNLVANKTKSFFFSFFSPFSTTSSYLF